MFIRRPYIIIYLHKRYIVTLLCIDINCILPCILKHPDNGCIGFVSQRMKIVKYIIITTQNFEFIHFGYKEE